MVQSFKLVFFSEQAEARRAKNKETKKRREERLLAKRKALYGDQKESTPKSDAPAPKSEKKAEAPKSEKKAAEPAPAPAAAPKKSEAPKKKGGKK